MTNTNDQQQQFLPTGRLHFGVNIVGPAAEVSFNELRTLAQTAERGVFSLLTLDERYWLREDPGARSATDPVGSNDVAVLSAALAGVTTNIGLVVAAAPDYDEPADLARRLDSLDRISQERAAWQVLADGAIYGEVSSTDAPDQALLEASDTRSQPGNGRRALIEATQQEWQTPVQQEPHESVELLGAFERDGQKYGVGMGMLRRQEPRRGPVLIHGGDSEESLALAAELAEVILSEPASLEGALAFRRDLTTRVLAAGRGANDVKIMQGATFILAATTQEAQVKAEGLRRELPETVWDDRAFIGSYTDVAELLVNFARCGAVDGFIVMPWLFAEELPDLVNHLIPELQRRGAYPIDYAAATLRETLGLAQPGGGRPGQATHSLPVIEVGELGDVHLDLDLRMELIVQKLQA